MTVNFSTFTQRVILQENPTFVLLTTHMNAEGEYHIKKLCLSDWNIFYYEDQNVTFTNPIIHNIPAKDEIPVYISS